MPAFDESDKATLRVLVDLAAQNTKDIAALRSAVEGTHRNIADVLETLKLHMHDPDAHTRENP